LLVSKESARQLLMKLLGDMKGATSQWLVSYIQMMWQSVSMENLQQIVTNMFNNIPTDFIASIGKFVMGAITASAGTLYSSLLGVTSGLTSYFTSSTVYDANIDPSMLGKAVDSLLQASVKYTANFAGAVISKASSVSCSLVLETSKYFLSNVWKNAQDNLKGCIGFDYIIKAAQTLISFILYFYNIVMASLGLVPDIVKDTTKGVIRIGYLGVKTIHEKLSRYLLPSKEFNTYLQETQQLLEQTNALKSATEPFGKAPEQTGGRARKRRR